MKKIIFILLFATLSYGYSYYTNADYERRISKLEQQIAILNSLVQMNGSTLENETAIQELSETDEDDGVDETEDCDTGECVELMSVEEYQIKAKTCITVCTEMYNKSWTPDVDSAHECMFNCMMKE